MKLYTYTGEARVARFSATENFFLEIFSQKYEVRILIFFKTFKDGIWYYNKYFTSRAKAFDVI